MVVLGSWPYEHTKSLDKLYRDTGIEYIYLANDDKIVLRDDVPEEYEVDDVLRIAADQDTQAYIARYKQQLFPPDIPEHVEIEDNEVLTKMMEPVIESGAIMIVNGGNDPQLMESIGARWNDELGMWFVTSTHLHAIKEKKAESFEGRVMFESYLDTMVKVWGDTSQYVDILLEHDGTYHEADDVWYLPVETFDVVASMINFGSNVSEGVQEGSSVIW